MKEDISQLEYLILFLNNNIKYDYKLKEYDSYNNTTKYKFTIKIDKTFFKLKWYSSYYDSKRKLYLYKKYNFFYKKVFFTIDPKIVSDINEFIHKYNDKIEEDKKNRIILALNNDSQVQRKFKLKDILK